MEENKKDMNKENRTEIGLEAAEQVAGGRWRTVNTGVAGLNAALRSGPSLKSKQIDSLPNDEQVDTITGILVKDPNSGRNFVQVKTTTGKTGWIAASIIGMKR